ncbi:MAG: SCO family protein [Chitinophagales bacterium]|nr:SCO family protein [Chitinophagales bacterium]MCZ2392371.1 SCO family protein [Chitinophagales bacterium]
MLKSILSLLILWIGIRPYTINAVEYNLSEEQELYQTIPNLTIQSTFGEFQLSELYHQQPIIIAYIFTRCSGICYPYLLQLNDHIQQLNTQKKFKILVLSFDPRDQLADMQNLQKNYLMNTQKEWIFAITPDIQKLNSSIHFKPEWNKIQEQYDHESVLIGVNTEGYISSKKIGTTDLKDIQLLLKDIHNEFVISYPLKMTNTIMSCFTYDPATGKKKPALGLLILLLPAVLTAIIVGIIVLKNKKYHHPNRARL